jgi:hypothetical protein
MTSSGKTITTTSLMRLQCRCCYCADDIVPHQRNNLHTQSNSNSWLFISYFGIAFTCLCLQRHLKCAEPSIYLPPFACLSHAYLFCPSIQEARQSPLPDIRSGQLFCKVITSPHHHLPTSALRMQAPCSILIVEQVLEFEILSRRSKLLPDVAAQRGASPRGSIVRFFSVIGS